MGSVLDFSRDGQRLLRLYITGDTLLHGGINAIAERFAGIDLCLIHLGGTRVAGILLTMDGRSSRPFRIFAGRPGWRPASATWTAAKPTASIPPRPGPGPALGATSGRG